VTIEQMLEQLRGQIAAKLDERNAKADQLAELRDADTTDEDAVTAARSAKDALDAEIDALVARRDELTAEKERDDAVARLQAEVQTSGVTRTEAPAAVRVGQEERTYRPDEDRTGSQFLLDIGRAALGDVSATSRLARHMHEEQVERGITVERAAGTGAFAGLVVPQYLTELYAPAAKANRPFANVCNQHELPPSGMTVNISRITTGTSAAVQSSENSGVSETNIDDTLLSPAVQTAAGQQTLSRQAIERGTGVEGVMLDDLFRAYHTNIDSTLLNQATNGLTNVATGVTYDDTSPTAAELYPKIIAALAGVEGALLDQDPGDNIAVMHSRRWYWLQSVVGTSFPFVQQPGIDSQNGMANLAAAYGSGARGVLPNGTVVIVDNNIATNLGSGTNEDEIYVGSRREFHLWEDPTAPMLIRAEQTAAASLGVLFVVYGYFAYTHARYAHARKVAGTGLVTPTF
jgi:HK97 family phage major capsid protein